MSARDAGPTRRFQILSKLGGGSMGSVHRALDAQTGRVVALKTAVVEGHAQLESLRAETAALARLSHPGIVPIVAHGVEDGAPYLAMELLEGQDLAEALIDVRPLSGPRGPHGTIVTAALRTPTSPGRVEASLAGRLSIPWSAARMERVGRVIVRLARALAYLHGEGVVHRDLKPENVLVVGDDQPVLVDFGLARFRFGRGRERISTDRGASGTPYYMSPEQIENQLVDARTDLYALGALIHHVVAGEPPFVADDLVGLLSQHLSEAPPRLSDLVHGVPASIDELVLALLEKDRDKRLAYAEDVVEVFASLGLAPSPSAEEPRVRPYVYGSACVGRASSELELGSLLSAATAGEAAIALVAGESGVGKSRFLSECLSRVPLHVTVSVGAAPPPIDADLGGGTGAADPAIAALRPLLRWLADHAKAGHGDDVARWIGDGAALLALYQPELAALVDPLLALPLPRPEVWNATLARALVDALLRVSVDRTMVIVVDDAQWADAATAAFFDALAMTDVDRRHKLFVVAAYRAEEVTRWLDALRGAPPRPGSGAGPAIHVVDLHPLDPFAMRELASGMLGSGSGEPALVDRALDRIAHAAQGNPFTLAETIRAAVEDGSLQREGRGRWSLAAESRVVDLLETATLSRAERVAEARVASLPPKRRRLAAVLAAIARPAPMALLSGVIGASDGAERKGWELAADLHELVVRGIAIEASPGAWSLAHDKLRERCYAALDAADRGGVHLAIGRALLPSAGPRTHAHAADAAPPTAEDLVARASHLHIGGAPLDAAEDALRAADAFEARSLVRETERCAELAWSFVESLKEVDGASAADVARLRGMAAARLGGLWASLGKLDQAAALLENAVALGGEAASANVLAIAHVGLGYVAYLRGQEDALFRHASAAADAARASGEERLIARAENTLGIAFGSSGSFRQAIQHYTRAAEIAERLGDRASMGKHWSNISINQRLLGDLDDARASAERALALTTSSPTAHGNAWANLGRVLLELALHDDADRALERACAIARRIGVQFIVAEAEWGRSMVRVALGEPHTAAHHASVALDTSVRTGLTVNEGMARRAQGLIESLGGGDASLARAVDTLRGAADKLEGTQEHNELADCLIDLGSVLERRGEAEAAAAARMRAREIYTRLDMRGRLRTLDRDP